MAADPNKRKMMMTSNCNAPGTPGIEPLDFQRKGRHRHRLPYQFSPLTLSHGIINWEVHLEKSATRVFTPELKRLGHLREFRQVLQYDMAGEVSDYLARFLPCYQLFLEMTVASAKTELTGSYP
jgi:hypothetical protein